jgi:hypothetical protein
MLFFNLVELGLYSIYTVKIKSENNLKRRPSIAFENIFIPVGTAITIR